MKTRRDRIVRRFSIGLTAQEWDKLEEALAVCYHASPSYFLWDQLNHEERNSFVKHAVWAISTAVIRQSYPCAPLACDLRLETPEERIERVGAKTAPEQLDWLAGDVGRPDNIIQFTS